MCLEGYDKEKIVIAVESVLKKNIFSQGLLNKMRLTFLRRRRKYALFSLPSRGSSFGLWLQVRRTLWAGRDLRRPSVQLLAQSRHDSEFRPDCLGSCLAGPESRGSTTSLGSWVRCSHSGIPLVYQVRTSPDSFHSHHRSLSWMHLSKDPVSVFLAALLMGTDRLLGDPPKSSHLQAEQALFPQPLLTGKCSKPLTVSVAPLWICTSLSTFFLCCGAQSWMHYWAYVRPYQDGDNYFTGSAGPALVGVT